MSTRLWALVLIVLAPTVACTLEVHDDPGGIHVSFASSENSYQAAADQFFAAMMSNDVDRARQVTAEESWPRIDEWARDHQAFPGCPIKWWDLDQLFDREDSGSVSFGDNDRFTVSTFYFCPELEFAFQIESIVVQRAADGWQVVDWSTPCEDPNLSCP